MGYFYLIVSMIMNTFWALCYKVAVRRKCNLNSVNLFLQIGAILVLLVFCAATGAKYDHRIAIIGVLTGASMFAATITFFYHMRTSLLAVSWTVIGLAIVFPVGASILLWHEQPTVKQWIGLALIPVAFACFTGNGGKREESK